MLAAMGVTGLQDEVLSFRSVIPWTCEFQDAVVHGPRGIVQLGDVVVADTLPGHDDETCHAITAGGAVTLRSGRRVLRPSGRVLSLLSVNPGNYYHWTMDGLARLAATAPGLLATCDTVLVPPLTLGFQRESLLLAGIAARQLLEVAAGDRIEAACLLVPWSMTGDLYPHPGLRGFFDHLAAVVPRSVDPTRLRLYIDRRASINRRLENEAQVIEALAPLGFTAVKLEAMPLAEQIGLFRDAVLIVAPHGAGLTNLVYARPGCQLIELQMDTYVHWLFRRLAAVCGVDYDCVIGRQRRDGPAGHTIHGQVWAVSVLHVVAAVQAAANRAKAATNAS